MGAALAGRRPREGCCCSDAKSAAARRGADDGDSGPSSPPRLARAAKAEPGATASGGDGAGFAQTEGGCAVEGTTGALLPPRPDEAPLLRAALLRTRTCGLLAFVLALAGAVAEGCALSPPRLLFSSALGCFTALLLNGGEEAAGAGSFTAAIAAIRSNERTLEPQAFEKTQGRPAGGQQ